MFSDWLRSNQKMYWISGKPGSGKTTLVRFLISSSQTTKLLEVWQSNPIVISHFLWRPGTAMQQSIKGMLCSILHQLLAKSLPSQELVINRILESHLKDSHLDWSTEDLQLALEVVVRDYEHPICLFLDGVDEVSPNDGVVKLLSVVHQLGQHPSIKICLSSRPEQLILKRLKVYPHLRMQDLTTSDLESFAQDHLQELQSDNRLEYYTVQRIRALLVPMAEGVFLWLCLAIKSVVRGLEYGDSMDEIMERIENVRGDLYALYDDMWKRMDGDTAIYRKSAATFFRLILEKRDVRSICTSYGGEGMSVLELLLATTSLPDQLLRYDRARVPEDDIVCQCRRLEQEVRVRCAGLLDIQPDQDETMQYPEEYKKLVPYVTGVVRFVHRTAYDFLQDTDKGKEILQHDNSSISEIRAQIYMAQISLPHIGLSPFGNAGRLYRVDRLSRLLKNVTIDAHDKKGTVLSPLDKVLFPVTNRIRMINRQGWLIDDFSERLSGRCSDVEFSQLCVHHGMYEYVKDSVSRQGLRKFELNLLLCFAVLRSAGDWHTYDGSTPRNEFCRFLLEEGADPNCACPLSVYAHPKYCFNSSPLSLTVPMLTNFVGLISGKWSQPYPSILDWLERLAVFATQGADFEKPSCCVIQTISKVRVGRPEEDELSETYKFDVMSLIETFFPMVGYPRPRITRGCACVFMLPAFILVDSFLKGFLRLHPELRYNHHARILDQMLRRIPQSLENGDQGSLVALYSIEHMQQQMKHAAEHSGQGVDLDKIPYWQIAPGTDTRVFVDRIRHSIESSLTRQPPSPPEFRTEWLDCIRRARLGHGSLLERLCDLGITRRRVYTDEKGAKFSWEEACDIPGKLPPWRRSNLMQPPSKVNLDSSEVAELMEHEECCKDWVQRVLDQE
jgi:hypothetical protein